MCKFAHQMRRCIKATNVHTGEFFCFPSKSQCAKYLGISPAFIYLIIEHLNRAKFAHTTKGKFTFEYIDEKDCTNLIRIPDARIGKIYNKIHSVCV